MVEGFCPYCAHQNPPDFVYCESCKRELPKATAFRVPGAKSPDGSESKPEETDKTPTEPVEPPPPKSAPWVLAVLAVAIAVIVIVAGIVVLTHTLTPGKVTPGASGKVSVDDMCHPSTGVNCLGSSVTLPAYESGGVISNTSACAPITSSGSGDALWFNFTLTGTLAGAVIPQSYYNGANGSYSTNPTGFYNNATAIRASPWSPARIDAYSTQVDVILPDSTTSWCLSWWDPTTTTVTVTLSSNVTVLVPPS